MGENHMCLAAVMEGGGDRAVRTRLPVGLHTLQHRGLFHGGTPNPDTYRSGQMTASSR